MIRKILLKTGILAATMGMLLSCNVKAATTEEENIMKSAKEVVSQMGVGWNLGNTLDSWATGDLWFDAADPKGWESCWGNPVTTKAMIDKVKEAGFKTLRVPTTWGYHMGDSPDYTIDPAWMARVKEVVDYGIDNGLYVILNAHHEDGWCLPTKEKEAECTERLESLWTQVAENFKNYDSHLIFEVQNEPRLVGSTEEWSGGTAEGREVVNNYNEAALKAIRATGGNNAERAVMMPTYGACGLDCALNDYKVPDDKNVIVSLHAYSPYFFAMTQSGTKEWGSDSDKSSLEAELTKYHDFFAAKGVPVVMGEFGTIDKNNLDARIAHAKTYVSTCTKLGMPCLWWDNNYLEANKDSTFGLLDRTNLKWVFPELKDALIQAYNDTINGDKPVIKPDDKPEGEDKPIVSDSKLALTANLNSWTTGYVLSVDIKNTSKEAVNGWTLKVKKDALNMISSWNVNVEEDGDYLVITPKEWNSSIGSEQYVNFGIQGIGAGSADFEYELVSK